MHAVRHILAQRHLAVLICAAALLLKLLVPTGYMIAGDHGRIAITICPGVALAATTDMPKMHGDMPNHGKSGNHGKAEMPCAFSALAAAVLNAIDPVQLAALIVFIMAIRLAGVLLAAPSGPSYLRPPLRGPPAFL